MTPPRLSLVPREPDNDIEPATGGQAVPASAVEHSPEVAVAILAVADRQQRLRILEALLFAASEPLDEGKLGSHLKEGDDIAALLVELQSAYASRGINLIKVAGKWAFRTAEDLSYLLERHALEERRLCA